MGNQEKLSEQDLKSSIVVGKWHLQPIIKELEKTRSVFVAIDTPYSGSFLAPDNYKNVVFLSASAESETANDMGKSEAYLTLDGKPHGAFTNALLKTMQGVEDADTNGDTKISYSELFDRVKHILVQGKHQQTPQMFPYKLQSSIFSEVKSESDVKSEVVSNTELMKKGMWHDPKTNLVWMRCSLGQTWDGNTCRGEANLYGRQESLDAAKALNNNGGFGGYTDWVVPHIEDLSTLRYCSTGFEGTTEVLSKTDGTKTIDGWCKDDNFERPTINQRIFPNTKDYFYWSSSNDTNAINFANGYRPSGLVRNYYYVRLVRASQ